jgi:hypothetical protein
MRQNELVRLIKPLYGLGDSGDYWGKTLKEFYIGQLNHLGHRLTHGCLTLWAIRWTWSKDMPAVTLRRKPA